MYNVMYDSVLVYNVQQLTLYAGLRYMTLYASLLAIVLCNVMHGACHWAPRWHMPPPARRLPAGLRGQPGGPLGGAVRMHKLNAVLRAVDSCTSTMIMTNDPLAAARILKLISPGRIA